MLISKCITRSASMPKMLPQDLFVKFYDESGLDLAIMAYLISWFVWYQLLQMS